MVSVMRLVARSSIRKRLSWSPPARYNMLCLSTSSTLLRYFVTGTFGEGLVTSW